MSSLLDVRTGAQRPRLQHLPAGRATSSGAEAVELAASAGLFLDDWQAWVLDEALAERTDGLWAAYECALIVPRQNGKGSILEALEIYHLFVIGSRLIVHSAHEFKTAREHFLRMKTLIEGAPELYEQVEHIHVANGAESIRLRNGSRLNFVARSKGSGRGFSGDLIVLDEAYNLPVEAVGAMGPALSAMPNPQVWYTSSAPHADSHVLHAVRRRGIDQNGNRLFFAEWGNEPGVQDDNIEALAAANPGYGIRLTVENIAAEREMMAGLGDEYVRERFGVPSMEDRTAGVFGPGNWSACADPTSQISTVGAVCLDVAPGMAFSSFAVAGTRVDGLLHGELIERAPGTGWVIARARDLAAKYGPIWLDPKGPVAGLIDELNDAHVPLREIGEGDITKACAGLQEKVINGGFRHLNQRPLDDAANGAAIRTVGDSWRWTRTGSAVDITPLFAVTVATFAAGHKVGPSEFINLAEV